jgi:Trk K+ transport system NAD-binding subunit
MRTPLVGQTLLESRLRELTGINVVGLWERGHFEIPRPETRLDSTSVLVLAGSEEQLANFDRLFGKTGTIEAPVIILGGGRVGCAAAEALREREIPYRIVENNPRLIKADDTYILGNAADINVLNRAGIQVSPSVFVTTHNDDLNIYLTIYCRRLRPDIQIISRATLDRNISILHSAGADLVMSHASLAANTIINLLAPNKVLMLSEGLNIFRVQAPASLHGLSLRESRIREKTGCSVIALRSQNVLNINPDPAAPIRRGDELILIGTVEAEKAFIKQYAASF